jgi:peroxiredoxin
MTSTQTPKARIGLPSPDIAVTDARTGETVRLSDYRGQDVLLVFLRGTWCPFCREQLRLLAENHERLTRAGITVVGVLCQGRGAVQKYLQENPLPFTLAVDEDRSAAKAMGTHYWLTYEGFNLSHPGVFIIDRNGTVLFSHIGRNMRDLPVATVIEKFLGFLDIGTGDVRATA